MKSYISILYAKTNSITDEKLSIGVIYFSDDKAILKVSEKKINIVQYITNNQVSSFLKSNLHLFENKINEINEKLKLDSSKKGILNKDYFEYLNKYSQGLISFAKLKPIYNGFNSEELDKLLLKFIGEDVITQITNDNHATSKKYKFNKNLTIYPTMVEGILKPITFVEGYYTKNQIVLFKEINLAKREYYLISELYELKALRESLANKFDVKCKNIQINLLTASKVGETSQAISDFLSMGGYTVFYNKADWRKEIESLKKSGCKDIREILTLQ